MKSCVKYHMEFWHECAAQKYAHFTVYVHDYILSLERLLKNFSGLQT